MNVPRGPDVVSYDDLHASKIDPDDPRLRVERPRSRALKMKPVLCCATVLLGLGAYAVMSSAGKRAQQVAVAEEPAKQPPRAPTVPAFIQEAPDAPAAPPVDRDLPRAAPAPLFASAPPPSAFAPLPPRDLQAERAAQQQAQIDEEAQTAGLFFPSAARQAPDRGSAAPPPEGGYSPGPGFSGVVSAAVSPGAAPAAWDPNLQGRKNGFLDEPRLAEDYLPTTILPPMSPYELKATAIIPATLLTGINSDLPGPIIAQVRERVFDTVTGQHLLIPQGARLLASYDSMVAWGQERVLLCWNRLVFPNGDSINLHCMPASDLKGQAGLTDEVDEHWGRLLAAAGLSTVLSLGVQAAAGNQNGYQPTLAQSATRSAAGEINAIGQGLVQRQLNIQPTITVRPGFGVNVIVTKDMILKPYVDGSLPSGR